MLLCSGQGRHHCVMHDCEEVRGIDRHGKPTQADCQSGGRTRPTRAQTDGQNHGILLALVRRRETNEVWTSFRDSDFRPRPTEYRRASQRHRSHPSRLPFLPRPVSRFSVRHGVRSGLSIVFQAMSQMRCNPSSSAMRGSSTISAPFSFRRNHRPSCSFAGANKVRAGFISSSCQVEWPRGHNPQLLP
jgi:hypothetical protein